MAANSSPVFPLTPNVGFTTLTATNTSTDGTGTVATLFTAGTNGANVQRIHVEALGTNVASVLRVYVNNGGTNTTAANNSMIGQLSLPATTGANAAALPGNDLPLNLPLPAGYKIIAHLGTAVAAGWAVTAIGADF